MAALGLLLFAGWAIAAAAMATGWFHVPDNLVTALVGGTITVAIAWSARVQGRRQTTLALHREYYSADFAEERSRAERFFFRYQGADWTNGGPYSLPDPDATRAGYSQVLRFFHRFATLYELSELDRRLAQRLLSREVGYWFGLAFDSNLERDDMYTRDLLESLRYKIITGERSVDFWNGHRDGSARIAQAKPPRWVQGNRRWTTKGAGLRSQRTR